ncbi:hypothetical protein Golob_000858 [Gossypium lobatum]|uniref:Uncharacterized protein n=2 Tax=Gossypium TaxID=3633 RepID=A0A7J8N9S6_9ROSI|nr:hypothetical protein [Gossypium lobatum]
MAIKDFWQVEDRNTVFVVDPTLAQKFRNSDINLEFEGKLDQMFMGIVTTSDKAWTLFSGTLPSEFFEDVDIDMLEENTE